MSLDTRKELEEMQRTIKLHADSFTHLQEQAIKMNDHFLSLHLQRALTEANIALGHIQYRMDYVG